MSIFLPWGFSCIDINTRTYSRECGGLCHIYVVSTWYLERLSLRSSSMVRKGYRVLFHPQFVNKVNPKPVNPLLVYWIRCFLIHEELESPLLVYSQSHLIVLCCRSTWIHAPTSIHHNDQEHGLCLCLNIFASSTFLPSLLLVTDATA